MASNKIQIKRSPSNATAPTLAAGELAYSSGPHTLWVGDPATGDAIKIAGKYYPGTLTANQALVANSTSGIDRVYAANVDLSRLNANGQTGTAGQVLFSGGSGVNTYWAAAPSTNVDFVYAWTNTHSFSNTITFNGPVLVKNTFSANSTVGTAGQVLVSGGAGANAYWGTGLANTSATYSWTNTHSFSNTITFNGNVRFTNSVSANGGVGDAGQVLVSGGASGNAYWGAGLNLDSVYVWTNNQTFQANITTAGVLANGSIGTAGYILYSGGASGNAYWGSAAGFGTDQSAQYTWTNTQTFTNTITFNSTIDGTANDSLKLGGTAAAAFVTNTASRTLSGNLNFTGSNVNFVKVWAGDNVSINTSTFFAGNTTVNTTSNSTIIKIWDTVASVTINSTAFSGKSADSDKLGGVSATNYVQSTTLSGYLTTSGTAADSSKLGGTAAASYALKADTTYIGTTSVALNRASASLSLTGVNIDGTANNSDYLGTYSAASYAKLSGALFTGTVNSTSFTTGGGYGSTGGGMTVNTTHIGVGNTTVNAAITSNSTVIYFTGTSYYANSTAYLGSTAAADIASKSYADGKADTAYSNAVAQIGQDLIDAILGADHAYTNAMADTLTRNGTYTGNNVFGNTTHGTNTVFNSNIYVSSVNVNIPNANVQVKDMNISGNLVVTGTMTTVDTQNLQVKDSSILVGDQQASTTTYADAFDFTFYGAYGNTSNTWYSGIYRDQAASTGLKPVWKIFATNSAVTSTVNEAPTAPSVYNLGTLQAYLEPYGTSGAFIANSSTLTITANTSFQVNVIANNMTLSNALTPTNGGTGLNGYSAGDIIYASGSSTMAKLSINYPTDSGYVLQVNTSGLPQWGSLDGGSF